MGGDLMEQRKLREGWRHGTYIYYSQCPANGSLSDRFMKNFVLVPERDEDIER